MITLVIFQLPYNVYYSWAVTSECTLRVTLYDGLAKLGSSADNGNWQSWEHIGHVCRWHQIGRYSDQSWEKFKWVSYKMNRNTVIGKLAVCSDFLTNKIWGQMYYFWGEIRETLVLKTNYSQLQRKIFFIIVVRVVILYYLFSFK